MKLSEDGRRVLEVDCGLTRPGEGVTGEAWGSALSRVTRGSPGCSVQYRDLSRRITIGASVLQINRKICGGAGAL
jgi:hypothetical protein